MLQISGSIRLEESINTLTGLGLKLVQAKVYVALVKSGPACVREISDLSKVPRTDLYRILEELEKKGLVERVIATPTKFKATPLFDSINMLLQRRREESLELEKKALKLQHDHQMAISIESTTKDKTEFILVPSGRVMEKMANNIDCAQKSLEVVLSYKRFSHVVFTYVEKIQEALFRGVNCRFVVEKDEKEQLSLKYAELCGKNTTCRVKSVVATPQTIFAIFDQKTVFIIENSPSSKEESSSLWSNNSSLVALASDHFEVLWERSMKVKNNKISCGNA